MCDFVYQEDVFVTEDQWDKEEMAECKDKQQFFKNKIL